MNVNCLLGREAVPGRGFRRNRRPRRGRCDETVLWRGFRHTRRARIDACDETRHDRGSISSQRSPPALMPCDETLAIGDKRRTNARATRATNYWLCAKRRTDPRAGRRVRRNAHQRCGTSHGSTPARRVRRNAHSRGRTSSPTQQQLTFVRRQPYTLRGHAPGGSDSTRHRRRLRHRRATARRLAAEGAACASPTSMKTRRATSPARSTAWHCAWTSPTPSRPARA